MTSLLPSESSELLENGLLPAQADRPASGWRAAVYTASNRRVNPGPSPADQYRQNLIRRARRRMPGTRHIAVSSLKGGTGKTTVSAMLGLVLAEFRGDRVIALDANPDGGTLADRLTGDTDVNVRHLLDDADKIESSTTLSRYTSMTGRLQVLASEQEPERSEAFNRDDYHQVCEVLCRYFNVIITDSGTGLVHSAMAGTLERADALVVVGAPTVDAAHRASKTLDWMASHGHEEQVADAVVVLSCDRVSPGIDRDKIRRHFLARCRAVVEVPYDPHLAAGGRIDLEAVRPNTSLAFLELAAQLADHFPRGSG